MDVNNLLCDYIEYITLLGKSKNISIQSYDESKGIVVLSNKNSKRIGLKLNKGSNSLDIGIFICPYKNSDVEILHPYKKQVKVGLNTLINIIDDAFNSITDI